MSARIKILIVALAAGRLLLSAGAGLVEPATAQDAFEEAPERAGGALATFDPAAGEPSTGADDLPSIHSEIDPVDLELRERELRARHQEMDDRERRLRQRETDLEALSNEVEAKLKRLEETREEVRQAEIRLQEQIANAQQTVEAQRAKSLAKIYGAMKPRDAAPLVSKLDPEIVRQMFVQMKDKQVAGIMAELRPDVAVRITEGLSKVDALKPKGDAAAGAGG